MNRKDPDEYSKLYSKMKDISRQIYDRERKNRK
jgi:hypothetical protein